MLIFAGAWPRMLPSDFRVRSLDGVADDWPLTYDELRPYYERNDRHFGVSGMGGDPAYPPGGEDPPLPPLPHRRGRPQGRPGAHAARLALVAGAELHPVRALRRPAPVRPARHLPAGLQRGRQGIDGPHPLAEGDRRSGRGWSPGPGCGGSRPTPPGSSTGATWIDRDGARALRARPASSCWPRTRSGRRGCCCCRPRPPTPTGSPTRPGWSGKRLMMHPFANVGGLFDEDLESWQGQFGCSIESFEFYETDERRGFVRGAKWGLAPTFGPINAALPTPGRRRQDWGPDHHLHVRSHLGHGANWGLFGEDLPDEANRVALSGTLVDCVRHPGARGPLRGLGELAPACWTSTSSKATESLHRGRRLHGRGRPPDALLRLAPAGHGADGRRPGDLGAGPLEPRARRAQPVRRRRQLPSSPPRASTRPRRSARSRCAPRTTWSRPGSTSRCRHDGAVGRPAAADPLAAFDAARRAALAAVARPADPRGPRHAVGGRGRGRGPPAVRARRRAPTSPSRCTRRSGPELGDGPRPRAWRPSSATSPTATRRSCSRWSSATTPTRGVRDLLGYPGQRPSSCTRGSSPTTSRRG